nr:ORF6 protein [Severe acute respiratory syndrome coronavirus 2]
MFHLVDFQVTIAEILLIIMRTFKVSIWNLDYIKFSPINLIIKNLSKSLTENKYSQLDEEQPMEID